MGAPGAAAICRQHGAAPAGHARVTQRNDTLRRQLWVQDRSRPGVGKTRIPRGSLFRGLLAGGDLARGAHLHASGGCRRPLVPEFRLVEFDRPANRRDQGDGLADLFGDTGSVPGRANRHFTWRRLSAPLYRPPRSQRVEHAGHDPQHLAHSERLSQDLLLRHLHVRSRHVGPARLGGRRGPPDSRQRFSVR